MWIGPCFPIGTKPPNLAEVFFLFFSTSTLITFKSLALFFTQIYAPTVLINRH